jgi:hypothetical protein
MTKLGLNAGARYSVGEAGCVLCVHRAIHDEGLSWLISIG